MKHRANKSIKKVIFKTMGLFLIALIFVGAFCLPFFSNKENMIFQKFFGVKAHECILELWNIDTFEGGMASKSSFLEKVSISFEKKNKGCYVLVRNMDKMELKSRLAGGEIPDMFSFSGTVVSELKGHLTELGENSDVRGILANSALTAESERLGMPWCMSGYAIITSESRLLASNEESKNVFSGVFSFGYEKKLKKSTKNIYSVAFGTKTGHNPLAAIEEEASVKGVVFEKNHLSILPDTAELTQYGAYEKWALGNSVALIGTARDLVRMEGRLASGKETDAEIFCLSYFTDLVQYIGVTKSIDKERQRLAEAFAKFLCSEEMQLKLSSIGLFSVLSQCQNLYGDGLLMKMESSLSSLSRVDNIFV